MAKFRAGERQLCGREYTVDHPARDAGSGPEQPAWALCAVLAPRALLRSCFICSCKCCCSRGDSVSPCLLSPLPPWLSPLCLSCPAVLSHPGSVLFPFSEAGSFPGHQAWLFIRFVLSNYCVSLGSCLVNLCHRRFMRMTCGGACGVNQEKHTCSRC